MRTIDFVNKEYVIAQNPKVTAINSCIEVDIVGNVCSDSIGTRVYSGKKDRSIINTDLKCSCPQDSVDKLTSFEEPPLV